MSKMDWAAYVQRTKARVVDRLKDMNEDDARRFVLANPDQKYDQEFLEALFPTSQPLDNFGIKAENVRARIEMLRGVPRDSLDDILFFLRRTIGSAPWLDYLDDEQWRVLSEEIMPIYRRAERRRAGISAREEMAG